MDYSALARSYNTLSHKNQLRSLLSSFYKTDKYNKLNKYELTLTINNAIFQHYEGEQILKYKLAKEIRNKNYIAAFEVRAKSSRTDFLVINGDTRSFEVKSKIDTLYRLGKQINDYGDVFEYNTVVIDNCHLKRVSELVPDYYGIWSYEGAKKIVYKAAIYSPKLNPCEQLKLFNKKELLKSFGIYDKNRILSNIHSKDINESLKAVLKERYNKRWNFLKANWNKIIPIDIQFFFNTNVKPEVIYGVNALGLVK